MTKNKNRQKNKKFYYVIGLHSINNMGGDGNESEESSFQAMHRLQGNEEQKRNASCDKNSGRRNCT